jgi:predicted molibdopterin-dependent oxidoreductase YjgC
MAIIAGATITEHPFYADIAVALSNLAIVTGNHGNLNIPGTECNTQGASDMGVLPDMGPGYTPVSRVGMNTQEMLKAAESGELKVLWIVGADLLNGYSDHRLAQSALENCPFIVINELTLTETASMADLILPVASMAEKDGTYTSCERRIQRIYRAFDTNSNSKTDWQIFSEVGERMGSVSTYVSSRDIWQEIGSVASNYAGIALKSLGETGIRWQYPAGNSRTLGVEAVRFRPPASASTDNNVGVGAAESA